jgi:1-acyl-sn-glycerol-3-phosphate acyltransferase
MLPHLLAAALVTSYCSTSLQYSFPKAALFGILVGYLPFYFVKHEKRSGYIWPFFQRLPIWKFISYYHSSDVVLEEKLDNEVQYIFCMFPHGACSINHFLTMTDNCGMLSKHYTGERRDLVASALLAVPVLREMLLFLGCVDAGSKTAKHNLHLGYSLFIYIGGEKEQLMTAVGEHRVYLKSRKGFIKLALASGADLVPMYAFGENDCYSLSNAFKDFRMTLHEKFQLGIPLFYGRWGTLLPYPVKIAVEIGKPIPVQKVEDGVDITSEMIDKLHAKFQEEMLRLFERTKGKYLDASVAKNTKLEIC